MAQWVQLSGSGAQGTQGPAGAGGSGTPAPNVTATASVFYTPWANSQLFGFSGTITLPTGDPDYSHLLRIDVMAIGPSGNSLLIASFTNWSGLTIAYSETVDVQPLADESWSVAFVCYNENGAPTASPYTVGPLTVRAALLSAVTGAEVAGARYQDRNQGLHTVIDLTPSISYSQYPLVVTFWVDFGDGIDVWQGWYTFTGAGQSWRLGEANSAAGQEAGNIWVPTVSSRTTWRVKAYPSAITKQQAIPSGYITSTFTVPAVGQCPTNDVSGASFINHPVSGVPITYALYNPGIYCWDFYQVSWTAPTLATDPAYWFSFITVQKGNSSTGVGTVSGGTTFTKTSGSIPFSAADVGKDIHITGVLTTIAGYTSPTVVTLSSAVSNGSGKSYNLWNPAADYEGKNEDPDGFYKGRRFASSPQVDAAPTQIVVVSIFGADPANWTIPLALNTDGSTNLDRDYRFRIYCVSRLGVDPNNVSGAGTYTLQTTAWSGADFSTLTPLSQPSALDLTATNPNTLGRGTALGAGNKLETKLAALGGLQFDGSGNNVANLGYTMATNGSGQIVLSNLPAVFGLPSLPSASYPQGSVILNTSDSKIYRNTTGSSWVKSNDPADLVAGAVAGGVTIAAAQITAGTLIAGVAYTGTLVASQVISGTFSGVSLVLNLNGITTSITNQFLGTLGISYVGFKCLDNSTGIYSCASAGAVAAIDPTHGSAASLSASSSSGNVFSSFGSNQSNLQTFSNLCQLLMSYVGVSNATIQGLVSNGSSSLIMQSAAGTIQFDASAGFGTRIFATALPSSNPGAGSKQLWYDPSDSNRVKFAV